MKLSFGLELKISNDPPPSPLPHLFILSVRIEYRIEQGKDHLFYSIYLFFIIFIYSSNCNSKLGILG